MRSKVALGTVVLTTCLACPALVSPASAAARAFTYISPTPGSRMVSPRNNIAIRQGGPLSEASLEAALLSVTGGRSGPHEGALRLTSDGLTVVFVPDQPFALGETVRVQLAGGLRTLAGTTLPGLDFEFRVATMDPGSLPRPGTERMGELQAAGPWASSFAAEPATAAIVGLCDTLLPGFPAIQLMNANAPEPGVYFMTPFAMANQSMALLQILDDLGKPLYQRIFAGNYLPVDFKRQPDGRLTFWMNGAFKFYAMDSAYAIVDSFVTGNGYPTDLHELQLLPNGHALLMSYDPQPVGMDTVVAGGDPYATVYGLVVQELDENKDVVFQWRSWDHFQITDGAVSPLSKLTSSSVDYVHANSIDLAPDGNLVISSRHMNEITKIDRQTGGVIWRMGLLATNNEFTFPNDARGFSHTHDARILPNGHLTVYDNGNYLVPAYSRAAEYELDEVNKIATLVWEYRHTPDISGLFMGNVQRHDDGSTTIGWGGTFGAPNSTDLHADGSISAEIQMPGHVNYRSFRFPWRTNRIRTEVESMDVAAPAVGTSWGRTLKVWNNWDRPIDITCLRTAHTNFGATLSGGGFPKTLAPGETTLVQVVYSPEDENPATSRLYIMQVRDDEIVAQTVDLTGHIDGIVGVPGTGGGPLVSSARPNPLRARTSIEFTLPSTGHVRLDVYDVGGRHVASLLDETRAAGRHVVEWSATGQRGGLFFYRLRTGRGSVVKKLVVAG